MKTLLRDLREAKRLTQTQVANACGMTLRNYQYLEADENRVKGLSLESAYKLSITLGCQIDDLIEMQTYIIDKQWYDKSNRTYISYESEPLDNRVFFSYDEAKTYAESQSYRLDKNELFVILEME